MQADSTALKVIFFTPILLTGLLLVSLACNTLVQQRRTFPWQQESSGSTPHRWLLEPLDNKGDRARRLASALMFETVSWGPGRQEWPQFLKFHQFLVDSFPLVHSSPHINRTVVNEYSLLYRIEGTGDDDSLPFMLAAHLDVVPVGEGWKREPFAGKIEEGVIYGRGALDDKSSVMAIMEALEFCLEKGHRFRRTFYVAFGHDEELSGYEGAGKIAEHLKISGADHLDFILDEGYFVLEDIISGVDSLVSVIGVTEKGYATLELSVEVPPGHSSIPPKESAIGILAHAVARLEDNPHPSQFGNGPELDFLQHLAPTAKMGYSVIFSNLWFFAPLVKTLMTQDTVTDALQRTTTAVTIFQAGYKSNVIPAVAKATINHRIHPSDTLDNVLLHDTTVIGDPRVKIRVLDYTPPTPVSPYADDSAAYQLIAKNIRRVYPTSIVAPACSPANTDLRHYVSLTANMYRLNPTVLTPLTRQTIHGDDERISVDDYHRFVQFYVYLLMDADEVGADGVPGWNRRAEL